MKKLFKKISYTVLISYFTMSSAFAESEILKGVGVKLKEDLGEGSDVQMIVGIISIFIALILYFATKNLVSSILIVVVPSILLMLFNEGFIGG